MFKKMAKRAKKASRSVLPTVISPQLVSFSFFSVFTNLAKSGIFFCVNPSVFRGKRPL